MKRFDLPPAARILVITLRRLGDALFATPLIASLRGAYPQATIDVLSFADSAGILTGNPDISRIITMPPRGRLSEALVLALNLAGRYDLAVSTQTGDRPTLFALIAGRRRVGPIDDGRRGWLRRLMLSRSVTARPRLHRLEEILRLADALGIVRVGHLVCPDGAPPVPDATGRPPYAVVHAAPMFVYKQWHVDGWRAVAAGLRTRGLAVVATGGPAEAERRYLDGVWHGAPGVERRDGTLSWPQLTALVRGACVFVGPDTSVTHLAAAAGCPTVALYGPTDPRLWGPVPDAGLDPLWEAAGAASCAGPELIQRRHNVWLVQHRLPCLPCQAEGCERHIESFAACLDALTPVHVLRAVDAALAETHATGRESDIRERS